MATRHRGRDIPRRNGRGGALRSGARPLRLLPHLDLRCAARAAPVASGGGGDSCPDSPRGAPHSTCAAFGPRRRAPPRFRQRAEPAASGADPRPGREFPDADARTFPLRVAPLTGTPPGLQSIAAPARAPPRRQRTLSTELRLRGWQLDGGGAAHYEPQAEVAIARRREERRN